MIDAKEVKLIDMDAIDHFCSEICDKFCKYRETCDEEAECEWTRSGNTCPLEKLI